MKLPPSAPRPIAGALRDAPSSARAPARAPRSIPLLARVPLGWRVADVYLALTALAAVELVAVAALRWRELAAAYELGRAFVGLFPLVLALAAPCALVGGAIVEVALAAERRGARLAAGGIAAAFGATVGAGVSTGRHFSTAGRISFAVALAVVLGAAAFAAAPALARALGKGAERRWAPWLAGTVAVVVLVIEVVNARVLPRLYPAFHFGLAALALVTFAMITPALGAFDAAASRATTRSPKLIRVAAALVLFAIGAAASPGAARRLALSDNIRLIYADHAPLLSHVTAAGAGLSPPAPLDDDAAPPELASGHALDLSGRDVVLVTIDALRADHVGAYGYSRKITPNLDRLAAEGVVFDAAYSPTPHTSYAVTSMMTGKYVRPLVLQGLGDDSETWAVHLRRYGYRTAAFYPPAVFFVDGERFGAFRERALDFEYRKVEFASAAARVLQVEAYLARVAQHRVFLWVHLFEPHEPYEAHPEHPLGERDIDRYDAEIAAADDGLGGLVAAVRASRPNAVILVAADHGEEFLEHGGRYHGTTVYEEQVRVPLVVVAPGLLGPRRVAAPVQLVDLLPTVLAGLDIPRPARVRGTDLGPLLVGAAGTSPPGFAFAETETQTLLARGSLRLVCARRLGACALYDIEKDPGETTDVASTHALDLAEMRTELRKTEASHGRYELRGLRAEGRGWPDALRRGMSGDGDAAGDVAALLDDADTAIRRKAAEVLFELRRPEAAPALRLTLVRDEDDEVRRYCAIALTRLGEGAPRTRDLVEDADPRWRRLAALALAESGDDRGEDVLIAWWREAWPAESERSKAERHGKKPIPFERAREIAEALARIRSKAAVVPLLDALEDVRLRPYLARALADIGEDAARPSLALKLETERYQTARVAIAEALVKLGAGPELRAPLIRLLGTPDPLPGGLGIALAADLLELCGGPRRRDLDRLRRFAKSGVAIGMVVPKAGNGAGVRVICRARSTDDRPGELRFGRRAPGSKVSSTTDHDSLVPKDAPELDPQRSLAIPVRPGPKAEELFATLPASVGIKPGDYGDFVIYVTQNVDLDACAVVPLSDELPPPPPEPWTPTAGEASEGSVDGL